MELGGACSFLFLRGEQRLEALWNNVGGAFIGHLTLTGWLGATKKNRNIGRFCKLVCRDNGGRSINLQIGIAAGTLNAGRARNRCLQVAKLLEDHRWTDVTSSRSNTGAGYSTSVGVTTATLKGVEAGISNWAWYTVWTDIAGAWRFSHRSWAAEIVELPIE